MSDIVEQVARVASAHSHTVCILGDGPQADKYRQALDAHDVEFMDCTDIGQIPVFASVIIADMNCTTTYNVDEIILVHNYDTIRCTLIDPLNQLLPSSDPCPTTEYFGLHNNKLVRVGYGGVPDLEHDKYFVEVILGLFPELHQYQQHLGVVYAGGTPDHSVPNIAFELTLAHVKQMLQSGITHIVFYNGDEGFQTHSVLACQRVAEFLHDQVPANTFFYVTSCLEAQNSYNHLCIKHGFRCHMHMMSALRFETVIKSGLISNQGTLHIPDLQQVYVPKIRDKNFVCFNRVPRWHRIVLLYRMLQEDLVKDSFYSFSEQPWQNINWNLDPEIAEFFTKHADMFPMVLNRTPERDNPVNINIDDRHYHTESYFSLVCETMYHTLKGAQADMSYENGVFISEKLFKPLAFKHPFVLVGLPHTLEYLRGFGYKTFSPWINEDYDHIQDDYLRMDAIVAEIQRLCSQTPDQWLEWQHNIKHIVEHNHQWLVTDKDLRVTKNIEQYFA